MSRSPLPRVVLPKLDRRDPVGTRILKDQVALIRRFEKARAELLGAVNSPDALWTVLRPQVARLLEEAHRDMCKLANLERSAGREGPALPPS